MVSANQYTPLLLFSTDSSQNVLLIIKVRPMLVGKIRNIHSENKAYYITNKGKYYITNGGTFR